MQPPKIDQYYYDLCLTLKIELWSETSLVKTYIIELFAVLS